MMPPRIGFIGLGIMGSSMAKNLIKQGFNLIVYNRTRGKTREFQEMGIDAAPTLKILALRCDVLITMVTDDEAVRDIMENPDGILAAETPGLTLINMSTVSAKYTKNLKSLCLRKAIRFIACPVSGSRLSAENANLVLLAGGDEADIKKNEKILLAMGKSLVFAGSPENAAALKLCVNLIVAHLTAAICESSILAKTLNINPELIFNALDESPVLNCPYFNLKKDNILKDEYLPAFALKNMLKDIKFIIDEAKFKKQNLPVTEAIEKLLLKSYNMGKGNMDLSVIKETLEKYYKEEGQ